MSVSLLIVEDDITFSLMLKTWLGKQGFIVETVSSLSRARKMLAEGSFELVLSDLRLPDGDGIHLLRWMNQVGHVLPFIIMTGYADIQTAVEAMKSGASDYIAKPVNPAELLKKIKEALQEKSAPANMPDSRPNKKKGNNIEEKDRHESASHFLEGESDAARKLYNYVRLVAPTNMSVLINGASGTGKEYVAHRIHQLSKREGKPFVAIDCGAIPKDLAASEFFGHMKGSFTGALSDKTGAFVLANGGALFLDEVGNLSYEVQVQLLRALQERRIRPIGGTQEVAVDVRLVSATNEDLQIAIEKGQFREDLYHRLNEFTLQIPELRERQNDILLFANFFLDQANLELGKQVSGFDVKAQSAILAYAWPGNLRQLKNVVKRATLLAQHDYITPIELGLEQQVCHALPESLALHQSNREKEQIMEALRQTQNNKSKAALLLGIDRKTLYNKLKLYDLI